MDLLSLGFVFAMCVAGAVIAWVADNLGRHIGKKKKSLAGIRPRHFATVTTMVTGFFLPLITILIASAASTDLRRILVEGRSLINQTENAKQNLGNAQRDLKKVSASLKDSTEKLKTESKRTEAAIKQREDVQDQLKTASQEIRTKQADLQRIRGEVSNMASTLSSMRRELGAARTSLKTSQNMLATSQAQVKTLGTQGASLQKKIDYQTRQLNDNMRRGTELDIQLRETEKQVDGLKKEIEDLTITKNYYSNQKNQLETQIDDLRGKIRESNERLEVLQEAANQFAQVAMSARVGDMIFRQNDELARVILPPNISADQAEAYLRSAMKSAGLLAESHGAKESDGNKIVEFRNLTAERTAEAQIAELVKAASSKNEPQFLSLFAVWNVFEGESVPIAGKVFANKLVYRAGDVILEGRVDGTKSDGEILQTLNRLVAYSLAAEVRRNGVIPPQGSQGAAGQVSLEDLVKLGKQIKEEGRPIRVQILAKSEVRAAGPVEIVFRLR
ncbi:MAG: DUF3084 domain-containing protein [Armatimonadetes bacterium]|nr:DUF3084 domain-containing protein [Armatimonadota bacterium]